MDRQPKDVIEYYELNHPDLIVKFASVVHEGGDFKIYLVEDDDVWFPLSCLVISESGTVRAVNCKYLGRVRKVLFRLVERQQALRILRQIRLVAALLGYSVRDI